MEEFEQKFVKPIINACLPGTLAALNLTILQVISLQGEAAPFALKFTLLTGATAFLASALAIFFYSIYPTRRKLWTVCAILFLAGLFNLIASSLLLFIV